MNNAIDSFILSSVNDRWLKVAKIIASVSGQQNNPKNLFAIEARLRILLEEGVLEAKGNPLEWRFSEVRLAQPVPKRA